MYGKNRLLAAIVVVAIVLSMLVIVPRVSKAAPTLSVSKDTDLTCGEVIWVNASGLGPNQQYRINLSIDTWPGTSFETLTTEYANSTGHISTTVHIPYRAEPGNYNLTIVNVSDPTDYDWMNITIKNVYKLEFWVGGSEVDHVIWNKDYVGDDIFTVKIYNWTGSTYELLDETVTVGIYYPDGTEVDPPKNTSTGIWQKEINFNYTDGTNYETNYTVKVKNSTVVFSDYALPVLLDITADVPTAVVWGDEVTISGYVKDGKGNGIKSYIVKVYAPVHGGGYTEVDSDTTPSTVSTGRFSMVIDTGDFAAGTWYIGTEMTGEYRLNNESTGAKTTFYHNISGVGNFTWYYTMQVGTDTSATVEIKEPDEIISGFNQTITVYVEWNGDPLEDAWVYVTGLKANYSGTEYEDNENISVGQTNASGLREFTIKFLETGTGTIFITWPEENDNYTGDYDANVTGLTTFTVNSPAPMNVIVENPPTEVMVDESNHWMNKTGVETTIKVYGDSEDTPINATINITGCGLEINIDESEHQAGQPGVYKVKLNPKTGGTLTITVRNESVSS
ncbi:MAG TPA: hypothetical protein ENG74_00700, partial [Thermoplasmatales archaeon]|nr:hypothetical protein [Thermoplasmatales archaeon]